VQTALANSFLTSGLYLRQQPSDKSEKSDKLIGLARATSDHVFNATIWDVLVDPAYQVSSPDTDSKQIVQTNCIQQEASQLSCVAGSRSW